MIPNRCVSAVIASLLLVACSKGEATKPGAKPAPVRLGAIEHRDLPLSVQTFGTVEANRSVAVLPQVTGLVTHVHFKEGEAVEQGQLLFTVDAREYQASRAQASAALAKNQATAKRAEQEAERTRRLVKAGIASEQDLVAAEALADSTAAEVRLARAQLTSAGLKLGFTRLIAPIGGRTGTLLVHRGNLVVQGTTSPLVVIRNTKPVFVRFSVSERYLSAIREQFAKGTLRAIVNPRGNSKDSHEGPVTFIENSVDVSTATIALKARFDNDAERLWPGASVDVKLVLRVDERALVAPEAAVQEGQDGPYAFVVDQENKARLRQVEVVRRTQDWVLVGSGLSAGERVVVDGQIRLRDGTPVSIIEDQPGADAGSGGEG